MFVVSNYFVKSKYCDDPNSLFVSSMNNKIGYVVIEEFLGLKSKICCILVGGLNEFKKAKNADKNTVAKMSRNENEGVLFIKQCLRH